eukprot:snap_masked-scaffold128_size327099-processed-gene-1.1 protein:Tk06462 transcript:snap_masked-scaffold128_size327099-processed-gene-1.1-mRNA-1 annotation:"hypothetical protein DAPPUDRAFT_116586"
MRTPLPAHPLTFNRVDQKKMLKADREAARLRDKAKERYDNGASELSKLKIGDIVRVQNATQKKWDLIGEIVEIDLRRRSYYVRTKTGRLYWRNRRFLRLYTEPSEEKKKEEEKKSEKKKASDSSAKPPPRRCQRKRQKPIKYREKEVVLSVNVKYGSNQILGSIHFAINLTVAMSSVNLVDGTRQCLQVCHFLLNFLEVMVAFNVVDWPIESPKLCEFVPSVNVKDRTSLYHTLKY